MAFQPTRVSRVLAAAAHPDIDPTDALDDIILHNAKAHADSPPGAILNLSDGLVLRIDQLLGTDAPPDADAELQKRLHPGLNKNPAPPVSQTPSQLSPQSTHSTAPTTHDAPHSSHESTAPSNTVSEETPTDDTETDPDLDPLA